MCYGAQRRQQSSQEDFLEAMMLWLSFRRRLRGLQGRERENVDSVSVRKKGNISKDAEEEGNIIS